MNAAHPLSMVPLGERAISFHSCSTQRQAAKPQRCLPQLAGGVQHPPQCDSYSGEFWKLDHRCLRSMPLLADYSCDAARAVCIYYDYPNGNVPQKLRGCAAFGAQTVYAHSNCRTSDFRIEIEKRVDALAQLLLDVIL